MEIIKTFTVNNKEYAAVMSDETDETFLHRHRDGELEEITDDEELSAANDKFLSLLEDDFALIPEDTPMWVGMGKDSPDEV